MADIINTDNGSVAAGKVNDKLATAITESDHGNVWASKVNAVTEAGLITEQDSASSFASKVNAATPTPPAPTPDLRVMQYNIGHFSKGTSATSNITSSTYSSMLNKWSKLIQEDVDADIIGMPEYAVNFGNDGNGNVPTKSCGIFDGYNLTSDDKIKVAEGGWWINVLASKYQMTDEGNTNLGSLSGANGAYIQFATVTIQGKPVKIGVTHLNWSKTQTHVESRAVEIKNLIRLLNEWLEDYGHVILFGDFNTDGSVIQSASKTEAEFLEGAEEFDPFIYGFDEEVNGVTTHVNGGFTLANHGQWGDMKTADATGSRPDHLTDSLYGNNNPNTFYNKPFSVLDNIIVKGFTMSNVQVIDDGTLTDHCAVVCDLTFIENE